MGTGKQSSCLTPFYFYVCDPVWRVGIGKPLRIRSFSHESRPIPVRAFGLCQLCGQARP